ncbi:MAG: HAD-IB family phosphatase [Candidatus Hodarchaeales archaeon]|jgi:2-hydroxy-3-keto-5-methylthiopentenyl-1-phosphate phosphatase
MQQAILCDFDGTLVTIDTAEYILNNYAEGNWRQFEDQLELGEITLEECLTKQFSKLRAPRSRLFLELEEVTEFRANVRSLINFCEENKYEFIITSAGLDFVIHHFLDLLGLQHKVKVYSAKSQVSEDGISFTFPKILHPDVNNFKEDLVESYKEENYIVSYIGDGLGDFHAIKGSNLRFTVRDSKLADMCNEYGIYHYEFDNFHDVIQIVKRNDFTT